MPKVVIKADDFKATANPRWEAFAETCLKNEVPATVGFISGDVYEGKSVDEELVSLLSNSSFELWNHSCRHHRDEMGTTDFYGRSVDEQLEDIRKTQKVALELFGKVPRAFGPPFNKYDVNTLKALKQEKCFTFAYDIAWIPDIRSVSKALYVECEGPANGRTFGLERAIDASLKFILRRVDFVLQVHPGNHWERSCLANFEFFIRYVRACGYTFGLTGDLP